MEDPVSDLFGLGKEEFKEEYDLKMVEFIRKNPYARAAWVGEQEEKPKKYINHFGLTPAGIALNVILMEYDLPIFN